MPPAIPRADTGTFNRLLASVGLILMAAALVIPYFYYRSTDTLEIGTTRLQQLTPTARDVIEGRQDDVAALQPFVLPFSLVVFAAGIGFLARGAFRLRHTQDRDDREAEARTIIAEAGVRDLTPEEKEDMIAEENAAAVAEENAAAVTEVAEPARPEAEAGGSSVARETRQRRFDLARRVEQLVSGALENASFKGYRFRAQVAVGRLKLDGLFLSEVPDRPDVLLEVKVAPRFVPFASMDRTLGRLARYQAERNRPCRVWLVLVVTEEEGGADDEDAVQLIAERANEALAPLGTATAIRGSEISRLPTLFPHAPPRRP